MEEAEAIWRLAGHHFHNEFVCVNMDYICRMLMITNIHAGTKLLTQTFSSARDIFTSETWLGKHGVVQKQARLNGFKSKSIRLNLFL